MLMPLLFMLVLSILIRTTAQKYKTPYVLPLTVSLVVFLVFSFASRGMIEVRSTDELAGALLLGIVIYAAVAGILYGISFAWIKYQSAKNPAPSPSVPLPEVACSKCRAPIAGNAQFCRTCGAPRPAPVGQIACPKCGKANEPAAKFCIGCGSVLGQI